MRNTVFLICYIFIVCVKPVSAQSQCTITHFDEFSGMAQWYVTRIVQDHQGVMWFATWNGLNRYDGYEFQCFKSRVGDEVDIPSDRFQDIKLASDGTLRCYADGHVFGFCTKTCKFFLISPAEERTLKQAFDRSHQQEEAFEREGSPNYLKDSYGTEWSIGQEGQLSYKDSSTGQYVSYPSDWHGAKRIRLCTTDKEGNAWFTSDYGAFKLTFYRKPFQRYEQQKPTQTRAFLLDRQQRYWITTREDATVRLYSRDNRLLGYLGADGQLHQQYTSFGSPVYHVLQDSKGTFWLCSKPDGLYRLREKTGGAFSVEHFVHNSQDKQSLTDNELYYAVEDAQGRLWIATFNRGVNCIPDPQAERPVFLSQDNILKYPKEAGQRVRQFHITRQHILLAATTTGLMVADISPKDVRQITFTSHTKDIHRTSSLSNNATMYVSEDSRHRIYVCTESGGVNQVLTDDLLAKQLEFRHYNLATGFPSDIALSAVPSGKEMIVVSNNQIVKLRPDEDERQGYETFFWQDKLRFSDATPIRLPDGRAIFGLQNGAITIKPGGILKSDFIPPIVLTSLSVNNGPIDHAVNRLDTLVLNPPQRDIFLQFAALDYKAEGTIEYAFRLGSGDEPWNPIGKNHSVTFLDLDPGTYLLQVKSTNSDGVWVENVRTLTLIVTPTFWETRWAKALLLLLIAAIVWGILRTRQHIINLNQRQQELHEAYLALLNTPPSQPSSSVQEDTSPAKPKMKPEDEAFMRRSMKFIEEHLGDADINIGDMADATATSRSGLNRKMKSLLGVTPLDFIREARIRKACQLLKEGAHTADVSCACGFSDPKYFSKCFKAQIGMTPREYREKNLS